MFAYDKNELESCAREIRAKRGSLALEKVVWEHGGGAGRLTADALEFMRAVEADRCPLIDLKPDEWHEVMRASGCADRATHFRYGEQLGFDRIGWRTFDRRLYVSAAGDEGRDCLVIYDRLSEHEAYVLHAEYELEMLVGAVGMYMLDGEGSLNAAMPGLLTGAKEALNSEATLFQMRQARMRVQSLMHERPERLTRRKGSEFHWKHVAAGPADVPKPADRSQPVVKNMCRYPRRDSGESRDADAVPARSRTTWPWSGRGLATTGA